MKFEEQKSTPRNNPKAGVHVARLISIVDLGIRPGFMWEGAKTDPCHKFDFTYELVNSMYDEDLPHHVSEEIPNKLSKEGAKRDTKLSNRVASLQGLPGDPNSLLGKACMVEVQIKNDWPRVVNVTGVPEGIPVKALKGDAFLFDLADPTATLFNKIPEFKQKRVKENLNYQGSKLQQMLDVEISTSDNSQF